MFRLYRGMTKTTQFFNSLGILISQYKDPYKPTSKLESRRVFFPSSIGWFNKKRIFNGWKFDKSMVPPFNSTFWFVGFCFLDGFNMFNPILSILNASTYFWTTCIYRHIPSQHLQTTYPPPDPPIDAQDTDKTKATRATCAQFLHDLFRKCRYLSFQLHFGWLFLGWLKNHFFQWNTNPWYSEVALGIRGVIVYLCS